MRQVMQHGEETFFSFFTIDMPINDKQVNRLRDEIEDIIDDDVSRWVWDTCEGVWNDGYGSFRFEWPANIMNFLSEDQRQKMEDQLNEIVGSTDIVTNMCYLHSYNEGDIEINDADDVEYYIDAIIDAGYNVSKDDADLVPDHLKDAFNTYYATLKIAEEVA